jgi:predicted SAM-dependent methyltransferase
VRYGDIVKGLPVPRNSVARLYASHVLEHLAYEDALRAIDNSFVILEPGGVFRLIVPDLATRARRYLEGNARAEPGAAEEFMESTVLGERARRRGPMGLMTAAFGASKHRWMWDTASMTKALADAGFVEIRRCRCGDSNDTLFALVEQPARFFEGADEELALTCRKPA